MTHTAKQANKERYKEMKMIARVLCAAAVAVAIAGCDQGKKEAPAPDAKAAVKEAKDVAKEVKTPAAPAAPAKK